jgi:hypothetical protein
LRSASSAFCGPSETSTTSPSPVDSFTFSASSIAFASNALSAASPERSSLFVPASIRFACASGTCFTQTAIFIAPDSNEAGRARRARAGRRRRRAGR